MDEVLREALVLAKPEDFFRALPAPSGPSPAS
jgi:hypothetical protein